MRTYGTFTASQGRSANPSYFKVYVCEDGLHIAWLASIDATGDMEWTHSAHPTGGEFAMFAPLLRFAARRRMKRQLEMEAFYDAQKPGSPAFLAKHKRNLSLRAGDYTGFSLRAHTSRNFYAGRLGYLDVQRPNARVYTLNLDSERDFSRIAALLQPLIPTKLEIPR